jgi:hypothetical protein
MRSLCKVEQSQQSVCLSVGFQRMMQSHRTRLPLLVIDVRGSAILLPCPATHEKRQPETIVSQTAPSNR